VRLGFTLIEVLVALTIGAAVVLMVQQAFGGMLDLSAALETTRASHQREAHAREALETAFGSLEIGTPGATGFQGSPQQVTFTTMVRNQPRAVRIAADGRWLILQGTRGAADTLLDSPGVAFDYLMSYGAQARWVQGWSSPASAPLAVRLKVRRDSLTVDTLFFLIGPRG
jgi:prepilin-type N-terminal cleavage/methylation domain-containing protein